MKNERDERERERVKEATRNLERVFGGSKKKSKSTCRCGLNTPRGPNSNSRNPNVRLLRHCFKHCRGCGTCY